MEFFARLRARGDADALQERLTIASLADHCALIDRVLETDGEVERIWCLWGEFAVRREPIRGGVRFSLPNCPNALAWTITTELPPTPDELVVHCTINRADHDPDFVESIEAFVAAWREGLDARAVDDGRSL